MTQDPFGARFVAGYDEPPTEARVRTLLIQTLLGPQPDFDRQCARLIEFDFNPANQDPIAVWQVVTTSEACPRCLRAVEAGEHMAVTARGRRLCTDCGT